MVAAMVVAVEKAKVAVGVYTLNLMPIKNDINSNLLTYPLHLTYISMIFSNYTI